MKFSGSASFVFFACAAQVLGEVYSQSASHQGDGFYKSFSFEAISDPTHGRVNYVDQSTAQAQNLSFSSGDTFIIRVDDTSVLSSSGPGRNSVRIQSNEQYNQHVAVFNIRHMPQGCGTWPAVWEVGADWPSEGEVDVLEGVNDVSPDQATLHTSPGCTMPASRDESGTPVENDCDTSVNNNAGCGVKSTAQDSYGPSFNAAGGGWYAVERTPSEVKVWFWSRSSSSVPSDVLNGETSIDTDNWGQPFAYFPDTDCDFDTHFGWHNIVINIDLCGDWAGSVFGDGDSCSGLGDCNDYVDNNPSAFSQAYFDFEWLKIYT